MSAQTLAVPQSQWAGTVLRRVPGTRLLGRYEGGGYVDDRYLVMRPDGQPVLLTRLPYLVVRHADGGNDARRVADKVSQDYGRRLSLELLARLIEDRLVPAGLMPALAVRPSTAATRRITPLPVAGSEVGQDGAPASAAAVPDAPSAPARAEPFLSVTLSQAFLPARAVRRLAGWASPAFNPLAITAVLLAFVAGDLWLFLGRPAGGSTALTAPGDLLAVLALLGLATLVHEVGHAAGCRYGGGRPGAIGAGLYLWFPVFWTDVTDAYRLDRVGRLRTDLGGVYFNALFVALATAGYAVTGWTPLVVVVILTNIVALQQLLPVIRMDGYYILGDLTGVPNLFGLLMPSLRSMLPGREIDPRVRALRPGVRRVVAVWAVVSTAVLGGSLVALVVGAPALAGSTWSQMRAFWAVASRPDDLATTVYAWICLVLLVLPFVGFAALLARSVRMASRPARGRGRRGSVMTANPELDLNPEAEVQQRLDREVTLVPPLPRLTAADFTEDVMLRARRRPPRSGWRRHVFLATGGVVHPGPSAAERRESELIERVRTRLTSTRRIVVLSRKGGAGKTTTTLMLGHTLAMHRGDRVVALDANPDAGSLPYRVERESSATVTSLLADVDRLTSYAQVRAHTSQAPSRLEIVASDDDPRITHALGQADYSRAIGLLDQHYMLLLMDTGTGILDEATQGLLREADQVLVVMPPALDGARVAASTLDWLDEHGYTSLVRGAVAVINGVRGEGGLVQLEAIEAHFRARCAGVVQIPWDRALEAGARTAPEDLRPATRTAYLELAATVADGFTAGQGRSR